SNVLALMASQLATGLFQRAIVQSGALEIESMEDAQQIGKNSYNDDRLSSREIAARWLVNTGRASDKANAIAVQDETVPEELALWLRSLSPQEMYSIFDTGFAGMIRMPMILGDGYVLPKMKAADVFADSANYASVPVMIGSTRDEMKLFMAFSPEYVEFMGNIVTGIRDLDAYNRDVKYGTDMWRAEGVDQLAELMSQHNPDVYAYRFDADDWRNFGVIDLKELIGAAHALEIPFVFGYFPAPAKIVFPDSTFGEVELLSNAMMSYWTEFAYHGKPGMGRNGEELYWEPWRDTSRGGHYMILDTELDGGIRMTEEVLSLDEVKAAFFADSSHKTKEERCLSYRSAFVGRNYDMGEYTSLGCQ
ncbi:MAG: carboxylesterase family protein, partial [Gammaproteobacteria bacterium]|nr:carboxylesterase family protein [Gammaproteobacteria bacterium]